MKLMRLTLCVIILLVTASSCAASDVYYIKQINNNIYYNKGSWPDENSTHAEILNLVISKIKAQSGNEVYISSGEYKITSVIKLNPGMKLYGSFDALTENTPNERKFNSVTSIDAKSQCSVIEYTNETANNADTRLDGFVIANGKSSGMGAGIYIYKENLTITIANCVFINNNSSSSQGGAIYNKTSSTKIINCAFINNSGYQGGAVYNNNSNADIINCTFKNNKAYYNTSAQNTAISGGALYNNASNNYKTMLINCSLIGNEAKYRGGGIFNFKANLTVKHCNFINNKASDSGAEIYNQNDTTTILTHSITDTIIFNNNANQAGIYNDNNNNLDFKNCALNVSINGGQVTSSDIIYLTSLDLNNLQEVKINGVPHVILSLDKSSALVNAGVSCDVSLDQLGQPRGLKVDIGSFEYQPEFLPEVVTNDFMNINNAVISLDLLMSMGSFDVEFKDIADKIEFTGIISPDWLAFNQISPLQGRFTFVESPDDGTHTIFMNLTNALGVKEYNFTFTVKSKDEEPSDNDTDADNGNSSGNDNDNDNGNGRSTPPEPPINAPSPVADDTGNNYDYNNNVKHDDEAEQDTDNKAPASDDELIDNIDNGLSSEDYNNFDDNNGENNNEDNDPRTTDSDDESGDIKINNIEDEDNSSLLPGCGINLNLPLAYLAMITVIKLICKNKGRRL